MKNKILLAVFFLSAIVLTGCGRIASAPQPAIAGYSFKAIINPQKMTHRTLNVYKPADWQEVKKDMVLYYAPPGTVATDTVAEKIIIAVYSVPKNSTTTLAQFMKNDFDANQKLMGSLKFIAGAEPVKLGTLSGREEKYENQLVGKKLIITEIEARTGDLLYKIQHSCAEGACQADAIFAEMAASFEVVPQSAAQ